MNTSSFIDEEIKTKEYQRVVNSQRETICPPLPTSTKSLATGSLSTKCLEQV
jgi:hypothetical protein